MDAAAPGRRRRRVPGTKKSSAGLRHWRGERGAFASRARSPARTDRVSRILSRNRAPPPRGGAQSSGNRSRLRPAPRTVTPAGRAPSCVLALLRPGSRPPPRPRAARRGPPAARLAPRRTFTRLVLSSPTVIVAAAPSRSSSHRSAIRSPDVERGPGTRQGRSFLPMIDIDVARRLRDAGLPWEPTDGDLFAIDNALLREEAFMLSSMVVEVGRGRTGTRVLRFNGTTEWALDSVEQDEAVWLPREDQLREALGAAFSALRRREDGGFVVELRVGDGELREVAAPKAEDALAGALL